MFIMLDVLIIDMVLYSIDKTTNISKYIINHFHVYASPVSTLNETYYKLLFI